jgi:DNA-binding transcriptional MerR regulator
VSSRTYLSIGDVLTLLREEFPDVTISKIRFLESQGLVNPERSPSGYRKFFDHDVERLRWVLRQQREHFLPLKVIRDRLADGDLGEEVEVDVEVDVEQPNGKEAQPAQTVAVGGAAPAEAIERPTTADEEAMARILADASRRAARLPEQTTDRRGRQMVAEADVPQQVEAEPAVPRGAAPVEPAHRDTAEGLGSSGRPRHAPGSADRGNGTGFTRPSDTGLSTPAAARSEPESLGSEGGADATATARAPDAAVVTGASLSADELCAASGLSLEEVAGLKGFGLVESVNVAGIETYDEEALTVANLAAAFRGFGIEPRHLRLYRNAADRELGLIEQVVIPLLRQRNPESRQRAVDGADQLAALGQSMRASLLRQALRRHLGG